LSELQEIQTKEEGYANSSLQEKGRDDEESIMIRRHGFGSAFLFFSFIVVLLGYPHLAGSRSNSGDILN